MPDHPEMHLFQGSEILSRIMKRYELEALVDLVLEDMKAVRACRQIDKQVCV